MSSTDREDPRGWTGWYHDAAVAAAALPALLVDATAVAHTVAPGWHGRRRPGTGESFWQYRRFTQGDLPSRIDWRRSARDDHLYIREQEWEAAHTAWIWPDRSASMAFRSEFAPVSKERRAIVMALALADILVRGGERVGAPGVTRAMAGHRAPRRLAEAMSRDRPRTGAEAGLPPGERAGPGSDYVIFSDLLHPLERLDARLAQISAGGARFHLIQIVDPVEETFPFTGRVEFEAPEGGQRYMAGRAETLREGYKEKLAAHREGLREIARRRGGSFVIHRTDQPPHPALLALHGVLSAPAEATLLPAAPATQYSEPPHLVAGGTAP